MGLQLFRLLRRLRSRSLVQIPYMGRKMSGHIPREPRPMVATPQALISVALGDTNRKIAALTPIPATPLNNDGQERFTNNIRHSSNKM